MNNYEPLSKNRLETAALGGGCFWCLEPIFSQIKGVISVIPGYAGGIKANPTYEEVCTGKTGHAEVIRVLYDPCHLTYEKILSIFFLAHDPTTPNQQGADIGSQYRSIILTTTEEQQTIAKMFLEELSEHAVFQDPITTEIKPLEVFYPAEEYHHKYYEKNPSAAYCQVVISPKLSKLRQFLSQKPARKF